MIACLNVVVLAMAAYVVFEEPAVIVQAPEPPTPTPTEEERPAVVAAVDHVERPKMEEPIAAEEVPAAPKVDEAAAATETKAKSTTRRGTNRSSARAPEPKKPEPKAAEPKTPESKAPEQKPSPTKDVPIECIIDPASCDRGAKKPSTEAQGPRTRPVEDLPETLSQSALRNGFANVRSAAKACGPKHGAAPGESVEVKVSIAGGTGKVIAANALGDHAKSALGTCVANALSGATFDRFAKAQIGLKYTVRL